MISFHRDYYPVFSNFTLCNVELWGLTFTNAEAAYQSAKLENVEERRQFTELKPAEAKQLGRKLKLRENWDEISYSVMVEVLMAKFSQNESLRETLLSTGNEVIEENTTSWHDNLWGNCKCPKCANIEGKNQLGKALMEVREKLRK